MFHLKKILVPLDFSRHSTYALRAASVLARSDGARLILLHVDPLRPDAPDAGPGPGETRRDQLGRRFDRFSARVGDVPVVWRAALGDPAAAIAGLAEEMGCDLIVMGNHGRTRMARLVAESITEQVVQRSAVPLLAMRSPSTASRFGRAVTLAGTDCAACGRMPLVRTILAPIDVFGRSRHAARVAAALARAYGANLVLLHVQRRDRTIWSESAAGYDAEVSFRMNALRRMAFLRDQLDVVDCERRMARGEPVEEIIKQAEATNCDLIVMDAYGAGGRDSVPFAGVAERTNRPILVLKDPSVLASEGLRPGSASGHGQGGPAARPDGPGPSAGRDRGIIAHRSTRDDDAGVRVHHRDHPKLVGEGTTLREAADRLLHAFECERRRPSGGPRRSAIADAASDAKRYRRALCRARPPDTTPAAAHPPRRHLP